MGTVISFDPGQPDPSVIRQAADTIIRGGIIIYPTETVYGIGACIAHQAALDRIAHVKGRADRRPFLLLISDVADLEHIARNVSTQALDLARTHWPGPLTILFNAAPGLSRSITGDAGTVGCRISPHPFARALPGVARSPVTSTSANLSGSQNPSCLSDIPAALIEAADLVIDGGPTACRTPSTIIDATGSALKLIRRGALDIPGIALQM